MATARKTEAKKTFADVTAPKPDQLPPTNFDLIYGERVEPLERVRMWDEDRFEAYIHTWAYELQRRGVYGKVAWASGSGDKGRDVRAYLTDEHGELDCFQCKFYKDALTPGDAWPELAKLCFYTSCGDFRVPRKFYFVAPKDLGPELSTLIESPASIKSRLLEAWRKESKDGISAKIAPLTPKLESYVNSFPFDIISFKPQQEILDELKETEYFRRKFGMGGLKRKPLGPIPDEPTGEEENYIQSLRQAFAESLGIPFVGLTDDVLRQKPALSQFYDASRKAFYSAEQLYRFGRDTFPTAHCFEELQDQVYTGILGVSLDSYPHGFAKVVAVTTEAGRLSLGNHFLVGLNYVEVRDTHGICHQIVNAADGRLTWATRSKELGNG